MIASALIYSLLGSSPEAGAWFNVFAVLGEYFYHSNLRTPRWMGYFLQRPEHHSIHHQLDVHQFNYGDITWWDRIFGTFRDADGFAPECGFPDGHEKNLARMLAFRVGNGAARAEAEAQRTSTARPGGAPLPTEAKFCPACALLLTAISPYEWSP